MTEVGHAEAAFWAGFLRNRNVDAATAGDGAVAVAGGFALCLQATTLTFTIGAGTARPLRVDDCEVVEAFYAVRALPSTFELDEAVLRRDEPLLRERGYVDEGESAAVLVAPVCAAPPSSGIDVRTTTDRRTWVELITRAAADDGAVEPLALRTAQVEAAAAQVLVVASIDGTDAAAGAVGIIGDTALFYSTGVLPSHRGDGSYGALLDALLGIAHARGTDQAIVKTAPDGDAECDALQHGFTRNALRRRLRR